MRAVISPFRGVAAVCRRGMASAVHSAATEGFSVHNLQRYERGRPGYPAPALQAALDAMNAAMASASATEGRPLCVVELGSGTGKFTRAFAPLLMQQRGEGRPLRYLATEPVDAMRQALESTCSDISCVEVANGSGSSIPLEDGAAQAAFVAQAFHWMATIDTLKEVHRILTPGGQLFMIWNTLDYSKPWIYELEHNIIGPNYEPGVPRQQNMLWQEVFKTDVAAQIFSPLEFFECRQAQVGPFELIADRVLSISVIAKQSEEQRAKIRERLYELLTTHPDTRDSTTYSLEYCTHLYWCASKPR